METPEPAGLLAGTILRPYQKQSLAFMLSVERSTEQRQLRGNSRCNAPFEHDVVTIGRVCVGEPDSLTLRGESAAPHQDEYRRQNPKA